LHDVTGAMVTGNKGISEVFNLFFVSVFTTEYLNNVPMVDTLVGNEIGDTITTCNITVESVLWAIGKVQFNNAAGEGGLGYTYLKEVGDSIALPLAEIFSKSIYEGVVLLD